MRLKFANLADGKQVTIRPRRDLFVILFLTWWIALWLVGEVTLINVMSGGLQAILSGDVPNTINTFRYMWPLISAGLIVWTVIGVAMIYALFWEILGREEITVNANSLSVRRRIVSLSIEKTYPRKTYSSLRFDNQAGWWLNNLEYWGIAGGKLAFDSGDKIVRVGRSLDETSAQSIASELRVGPGQQPTT